MEEVKYRDEIVSGMDRGLVEPTTGALAIPRGKGGSINLSCWSGHRGLGTERAYYELVLPFPTERAEVLCCDRMEIVSYCLIQETNTKDSRWNTIAQWANSLPNKP